LNLTPPDTAQTMLTTEKNKGGQKACTNEGQRQWLTDKLPEFSTLRNGKNASDFWANIFEGWFQRWLLGYLSVQEMEFSLMEDERLKLKQKVMVSNSNIRRISHWSSNQQQIKDWFKNHS